jgi:hypothetical protein
MNKNLYRIVFNKARGMLMVVADIARSGRAGSARSSAPEPPAPAARQSQRHQLQPVAGDGRDHPAQANIVADAGRQKPAADGNAKRQRYAAGQYSDPVGRRGIAQYLQPVRRQPAGGDPQ